MTAIISPCGLYRYRLERGPFELLPLLEQGDDGVYELRGKVIGFFGVNPSIADASINDATVRKWIGFCRRWGAARFIVGNVSPFRATDVRELASHRMPIGPLADQRQHLLDIIRDADVLVPCWGNRSKAKCLGRDFDLVFRMLAYSGKPVMHFGLTASGDPKHPLMLGYDTPLTPFENLRRAA